jgi:putative transposase
MNALASLSESARKIALDRFRLLQPHLEEQRLLKAVVRDAGIGYRTAQRWKMRYRKYGLPGLARDDRSDRGWRRAITVELKEILEALALQKPPLPIAALHRQICTIAQQRGVNLRRIRWFISTPLHSCAAPTATWRRIALKPAP